MSLIHTRLGLTTHRTERWSQPCDTKPEQVVVPVRRVA
jgi:hypothetical protein